MRPSIYTATAIVAAAAAVTAVPVLFNNSYYLVFGGCQADVAGSAWPPSHHADWVRAILR